MSKKLIFAALVILGLFSICAVYPVDGPDDPKARVITVTGEAQVNVVPDEVIFNIGVAAGGDSPTEAKNKEAALAAKVIKVAGQLGIEHKDIQTDYLEIDLVKPEYYDWRVCYEDSKEPKRYGARQMIKFTLRDPSKLDNLMSKVMEAGAIRVIGVDYRTSDLRKYRDRARAMAVKAAKEKAEAMAGELGQKIGEPKKIVEQPSYGRDWYYYGSWWWSRSSNSTANSVQNVSSDSGNRSAGDSIALGQIGVNAGVSVTFELM